LLEAREQELESTAFVETVVERWWIQEQETIIC